MTIGAKYKKAINSPNNSKNSHKVQIYVKKNTRKEIYTNNRLYIGITFCNP
jgi:hypothetical protein